MARRLRPASAWLAEAVSAEEAAAGSPPCTRMRSALRDDLRPMLASLDDAPRVSPGLVYEPKYDGIRAIVEIKPQAPSSKPQASQVQIYSRLGNEKTAQFPALVEVFQQIGRKLGGRLIIDGEIVALDKAGKPLGFQRLQGRMHLTGAKDIRRMEDEQPVAY
ncbi:MAG TPA: hypothetical protein VHI98_27430, partial [Vicinamibacterales bacterium]|nr:hypothetical protein [Vicinamibacterales bacterium]